MRKIPRSLPGLIALTSLAVPVPAANVDAGKSERSNC